MRSNKLKAVRECVIYTPDGLPIPFHLNRVDIIPMGHSDHIVKIEGSEATNLFDTDRMVGTMEYRIASRYNSNYPSNSWFDAKTPSIKKVIFNDPATIVIWSDNSKTVVKCQDGDTFNKELGLAMAISKKYLGNKGNFNDEFKKYINGE